MHSSVKRGNSLSQRFLLECAAGGADVGFPYIHTLICKVSCLYIVHYFVRIVQNYFKFRRHTFWKDSRNILLMFLLFSNLPLILAVAPALWPIISLPSSVHISAQFTHGILVVYRNSSKTLIISFPGALICSGLQRRRSISWVCKWMPPSLVTMRQNFQAWMKAILTWTDPL